MQVLSRLFFDEKFCNIKYTIVLIAGFATAVSYFFCRFDDKNMLHWGNILLFFILGAALWRMFHREYANADAAGKMLILLLCLTGACCLDLSAYHFGRALFQSEFGDETEKIVCGFFQAQGEKIYASYFSHHGVFPFMFAHLWALLVPVRDLAVARIQGLLIYALPVLLMVCFPAGRDRLVRVITPIVYLTICAYALEFWKMRYDSQGTPFSYGGIILYQSYAGVFISGALYLLIPIYFAGDKWLTPAKMLTAGGCLALAFFCAISYTMAILFTGVLAVWLLLLTFAPKHDWRNLGRYCGFFAAGGLIVVAATLLYLLFFGSIMGYLEYHFYYNLKLYPIQIATVGELLQIFFAGCMMPDAFFNLQFFMTFMVFAMFAMLMPGKNPRRILSFVLLLILLLAIVISSVLRYHQSPFQDSTRIFILAGILTSAMFQLPVARGVAAGLVLTVGIIAFYTAAKLPDTYYERQPQPDQYHNFINEITTDDDRVYLDKWSLYLNIPRRPTFYYWMREWIENYHGRSWLKPDFFLLDDLQKEQPAVIRWSDAFDESYFVPEKNARLRYLQQNYLRLEKTPYLIAKKVAAKHADTIKKYQFKLQELTFLRTFIPENNPKGFVPGKELHRNLALKGKLIPPPPDCTPEALGLYIRTFGRKSDQMQGEYRIKICDAEGKELFNQTRPVNTLTDKQWHYFKFIRTGIPSTVEISTDAPEGASFTVTFIDDDRYRNFSRYSDGETTDILAYGVKYQP